jgi:SPP1 gp7 family putative phage head morphogenesis protein
VTNRTLWLLAELRDQVGGQTDNVVRDLAGAWVKAWDTLSEAWQLAIAEAVDRFLATGVWPAPWQLARLARLNATAVATQQALGVLTTTTVTAANAGVAEIIAATAAAEPVIMASQLPANLAAAALKTYSHNIVPTALEAIALRARQQITATTWPISAEATEAIRRSLITGIATGANPREAARDMLRKVEGDFNGGLARAQNVARTEMLDAYRDTSEHVHWANRDVLDGWTWIATLDRRTCPSCWGMHGTHHPLTQPGPWDHQSGRCARMPKVKTWRELGIDMDELEDQTPDAQAEFDKLSEADQKAIVGPGRWAMMQAGKITLADIPKRKENPAWRPSYVPRNLGELEQVTRRRRDGRDSP